MDAFVQISFYDNKVPVTELEFNREENPNYTAIGILVKKNKRQLLPRLQKIDWMKYALRSTTGGMHLTKRCVEQAVCDVL